MAEQEFAVETYGVRYVCDVDGCGGDVRPADVTVAWLSHPVQFPHDCDRCGARVNLAERYPVIRYRVAASKGEGGR